MTLFCIVMVFFTLKANLTKASEGIGKEVKGKNLITVYLAGDSTVSTYGRNFAPKKGWGQVIDRMFDQNIIIENKAAPRRSSKSFINEGRLTKILKNIEKGDYLFIQFGHNDEKKNDPTRYTDPYTTYKGYLKQYIDGARKNGAIPVLITPVERRSISADGRPINSHGNYPAAMKELAQAENVAIIDLTAKSKELYERLGPKKTKELFLWLDPGENPNYPDGIKDNTHFQNYGAYQIANLVIEGIYEAELPLRHYISKELRNE